MVLKNYSPLHFGLAAAAGPAPVVLPTTNFPVKLSSMDEFDCGILTYHLRLNVAGGAGCSVDMQMIADAIRVAGRIRLPGMNSQAVYSLLMRQLALVSSASEVVAPAMLLAQLGTAMPATAAAQLMDLLIPVVFVDAQGDGEIPVPSVEAVDFAGTIAAAAFVGAGCALTDYASELIFLCRMRKPSTSIAHSLRIPYLATPGAVSPFQLPSGGLVESLVGYSATADFGATGLAKVTRGKNRIIENTTAASVEIALDSNRDNDYQIEPNIPAGWAQLAYAILRDQGAQLSEVVTDDPVEITIQAGAAWPAGTELLGSLRLALPSEHLAFAQSNSGGEPMMVKGLSGRTPVESVPPIVARYAPRVSNRAQPYSAKIAAPLMHAATGKASGSAGGTIARNLLTTARKAG